MSKEIKTEILIHATPQQVWAILTEYPSYTEWNPFIKSMTGDVGVGKTISVRIEPPNAKGMTFRPKILSLVPNKELRWLGHFLIPGLFDGEHVFELIDNGDGTTTFQHSEKFKGILLPILAGLLSNSKQGFEAMNEALKHRAENKRL